MGLHLLLFNLLMQILSARVAQWVKTLASHQCGPGSNPGAGMWVEFVVGFLPCCERFFCGYSGFPNSNSTRNQVDEEPLRGCATSKSLIIIADNHLSCRICNKHSVCLACNNH